MTNPNSISLIELSWLNTFLWFLQKHNFLECQICVESLRNPSYDFIRSRWASPPIDLVELLALS